MTPSTTVLPSCSNFKVLLTLVFFFELISKTNTLSIDLKTMGCIIAEKQWGHNSWVSCSKDPSHLQVDFVASSFSCNTKSSLSSIDGSEYSQLVHSGLEMATPLGPLHCVSSQIFQGFWKIPLVCYSIL